MPSRLTQPQIKIASCSHCGARTLLELSARDGHELACASCGKPLHEMKPRKIEPEKPDAKPARIKRSKSAKPAKPAKPDRKRAKKPEHREKPEARAKSKSRRWTKPDRKSHSKRRKSKPLWRRVAEDIWDEIEDIFD